MSEICENGTEPIVLCFLFQITLLGEMASWGDHTPALKKSRFRGQTSWELPQYAIYAARSIVLQPRADRPLALWPWQFGAASYFLNSCGLSSKLGALGKKSHQQANHWLIGNDGTKLKKSVNANARTKKNCFILKIHFFLQKFEFIYVFTRCIFSFQKRSEALL